MNFYKNGNYNVVIMDDGTKIRGTHEDMFQPNYAENIDITITEKCSQNCPFCYAGCTPDGEHASLFKYRFIHTLHPYTEVSLNGNDLDHPQFYDFLRFLKYRKIFTNVTVSQKQFLENQAMLQSAIRAKLIYGLGISITNYHEDVKNFAQKNPNVVLHIIDGITDIVTIDAYSNYNLKILILGYKMNERGFDYADKHFLSIRQYIEVLNSKLPQYIKNKSFAIISFDNLAIDQLNIKNLMSEEDFKKFYMGDDGKFTFFINMVKGYYAKNSVSKEHFEINNKTVDEMFNTIRS